MPVFTRPVQRFPPSAQGKGTFESTPPSWPEALGRCVSWGKRNREGQEPGEPGRLYEITSILAPGCESGG